MSELPTIIMGNNRGLQPDPLQIALYNSLTTPESEDWIIIPCQKKLFLCALRDCKTEHRVRTEGKYGWSPKSVVLDGLNRLPENNDLGVLTVYVTTDADTGEIESFLNKLIALGKMKSFNVLTMVMPRTTDECLSAFGGASADPQRFEAAKNRSVH
jgi:hypothetical protein